MKNALLLVGIWVGIVLIAYSIAFVHNGAPSAAFAAADRMFVSDSAGFELPVPAGWSILETDYGAKLVPPIGSIEAWVVAVDGEDAESAFAEAWNTIDPCPACSRPAVAALEESAEGTRATLIYAPGADARQLRGVAVGVSPKWVVLWIRESTSPVPPRVAADLKRIEAGLAYRTSESAPSAAPSEDVAI